MNNMFAMSLRRLGASLMLVALSAVAQADDRVGGILFGGYTLGGDTLVKTTDGREMTGGSGFNFGVGLDIPFTDAGDIGMRIAIGMKVDSISYSGGSASFTRVPFDLLLTVLDNEVILGIGGTIHGDPTLEVTLNNVTARQTLDSAAGVTMIMGWAPSDIPMELGFQATKIDYTVPGGGTFSGDAIGFYAGYKF